MKTLYFDLGMGAAGDMLTAALLELFDNKEEVVEKLNLLGIPGVCYKYETVSKCGINGTHISVTVNGKEEGDIDLEGHEHHHDSSHGHDHKHSHSSMHDIEHIVEDHLLVSSKVKKDILGVYNCIAEAESKVHGMPVSEIHFHEVGSMDALADITAVCYLMDLIGAAEILASPVHVGKGYVKCAHGILPVPAPATALILKDVPMYSRDIEGELCTPTGAALLKLFVNKYGDMPVMKVSSIGYGMGKKDFEKANCVRVFLGETSNETDYVIELSCNVDDMTPEKISFAMEQLFKAGARDVYTVSIGMKKGRPGILLRTVCTESEKEAILECIFKHTTTIGVRENKMGRYILHRSFDKIETKYGTIGRKLVSGYGVNRYKFEYEDLAKAAREFNISIEEVEKEAEKNI